tara:strand:- start:227 stop:1186 length:960 start_codon:yes stop_codon:yes gene_type:complete
MSAVTVTYSHKLNGWTSFFSYTPEWMIGMNTNFYSMYQGNLWRHRDSVVARNNFYGLQSESTIQTVFNDAPLDAKMFKTIGLEGDDPWTAAITTDFGTGAIDSTYFQLKEGDYYAYIRRDSGNIDIDLMSAQGIGTVTTVATTAPDSGTTTGTTAFKLIQSGQNFLTTVSIGDTVNNTTDSTVAIVTAVDSDTQLTLDCDIMASGENYTINVTTLLFNFSLGSIVSIGDTVYFGAVPTLGGTITAIDDTLLTISLTSDGSCGTIAGTAPVNGDYILYFKDAVAESYGARGYYMQVNLTNTKTTAVELFAITSEVFKSYP